MVWLHNDSGDTARLFRLDVRRQTVRTVKVRGAEAVDWEDMAAAPNGDLVIGDIGDNGSSRTSVALYRVGDPGKGASAPTARTQLLAYEDGAHDAEALVVDPENDVTYVITKTTGGEAGVYVAEGKTLRRVATVTLAEGGFLFPNRITAADAIPDGSGVVLRTYQSGYILRRRKQSPWSTVWSATPEPFSLPAMVQGESICVQRDSSAVLTTTESRGATKIPFAFTALPGIKGAL